MKKKCLFLASYVFSFYIYADDGFLITIENKSGNTVRVDVSDLGRYSLLSPVKMQNTVVMLENIESLELSIISKAIAVGTDISDKIKILSNGDAYSELVIEPASLNSKLMHIGQNGLSVNQHLRDTGVGYKITIPVRSVPFMNTRSSTISSWFKNIYSKFICC